MFVDQSTARRVERAEAAAMCEMVSALVAQPRAAGAFVRSIGLGVATYARADSPLNKVIGLGLDEAPAADQLAALEHAFHSRGEAVRVELCTLAEPATLEQLAARGYRLLGFENVLGMALEQPIAVHPSELAVVRAKSVEDYRQTVLEGFMASDDTGVVLDRFSQQIVADAIDDSLALPGALYVAYQGERRVGAGSMRVQGDVALLTGAATLRADRRTGVHTALIARRLADARAAGARLAIITTAPGTQSMANVMKHGFALLYARAVLSLPALTKG